MADMEAGSLSLGPESDLLKPGKLLNSTDVLSAVARLFPVD